MNQEELKDQGEILIEKITDKKRKNPKFTDYIAPLTTEKNLERIATCGDFVQFVGDVTLEHLKLHRASFCGNRFCPMCSWRTACKDSLEISILMEHLRKEENKEFIFLTLTAPNVKGEFLNDEIKNYNKNFKKLMERKEVKQVVKGYIRKLEVTYNSDKNSKNFDTYHPHFHVVLAVNKSYFKKTDLYINHNRWLELWRESTKDFTITQVNVKKARANNYKEVYELAKYSAKDSDYLINRSVFKVFYEALRGKQTLVFSGLFKDAHKKYLKHELDVYKQVDEIKYEYMVCYHWCKKQYINSTIRKLTPDELEQINKNLIDEDLNFE